MPREFRIFKGGPVTKFKLIFCREYNNLNIEENFKILVWLHTTKNEGVTINYKRLRVVSKIHIDYNKETK